MSSESTSRGVTMQSEPFPICADGGAWSVEWRCGWPVGARMAQLAKTQVEKAQRDGYERGLHEGESRASKACEARTAVIQEGVNKALKEFCAKRKSISIASSRS